jgi:hypothetical protein
MISLKSSTLPLITGRGSLLLWVKMVATDLAAVLPSFQDLTLTLQVVFSQGCMNRVLIRARVISSSEDSLRVAD